jgi:hypothetical protein
MSSYEDFWNTDETVAEPVKDITYQTLGQNAEALNPNADSAGLTPEEQFTAGWRSNELSDDLIKSKTKILSEQIDKNASTEILRRGAKREDSSTTNAEADKAAGVTTNQQGVTKPIGGGGGMDRTGGTAGNGTNYTDRQWAEIRAIRDEYGGMDNPFDRGQLKNGLIAGISVLSGSPLGLLSGIPGALAEVNKSDTYMNNRIAATDGVSFSDKSPVGYDPATGNFSWRGATGVENSSAVNGSYGVGVTDNSRASRDAASENSQNTTGESGNGGTESTQAGVSVGATENSRASRDAADSNAAAAAADASASSSSSSSSNSGSRVICTHFYRKGEIDKRIWRADLEFTAKHLHPATVRGYQYWAIPYVLLMRKSRLAENIMRPLAIARAKELAFQMGVAEKGSLPGKVVRKLLEPVCFAIGLFAGEQDWQSLYKGA